jgi:hypothetical protein
MSRLREFAPRGAQARTPAPEQDACDDFIFIACNCIRTGLVVYCCDRSLFVSVGAAFAAL